MRGKAKPANIVQSWEGITPAYAGKSKRSEDAATFQWDHPRLCGEKLAFLFPNESILGSPPPMRGKGILEPVQMFPRRITPAYAGKSLAVGVLWIHNEDHPRLCGEKSACMRAILQWIGSPPPMRGKDEIPMYSIAFFRITPAYAGKSCRCCEMLSGG